VEHPAQNHHTVLAGMEALLLPLAQMRWQRHLRPVRVVVVVVGAGTGVELGVELFDDLVSWWYISRCNIMCASGVARIIFMSLVASIFYM
jgi:hypothetical protein